jgi:outer membrane lipoprotein LolB
MKAGTRLRCVLLGFAVTVVAACAPAPTRPVVVVERERAEALQLERERAVAASPDWAFAGRVAISTAGDGGSGRIEWAQRAGDFNVRLSAPVTRQSWRLQRAGGTVRLEGLEGGPREGADAEALLFEATRWRLPVADLAAWVRGVRGPDSPARMEFDDTGRLAAIEQSGWRVEYTDWNADPLPMPTRVQATRGDARVRLAIERWTPAP